jgi:hypothetical protein
MQTGAKMLQIRNRRLGNTDYRDVMNTPQNIPSHDAISNRAREIWESSGQIDGRDLENWLQAERELLEAAGEDSSNETTEEGADISRAKVNPSPRTPASTASKRDSSGSYKGFDASKQGRVKR